MPFPNKHISNKVIYIKKISLFFLMTILLSNSAIASQQTSCDFQSLNLVAVDNQIFGQNEMKTIFRFTQEPWRSDIGQKLFELSQAFDSYGSKLAVILLPTRPMQYSRTENIPNYSGELAKQQYDEIITLFEEANIITPNLLEFFENNSNESFPFRPTDPHWNNIGSELAARALTHTLQEITLLEQLSTAKSEIVSKEVQKSKGFYAQKVHENCDLEYPEDSIFLEEISLSNPPTGLFDNSSIDAIPLLGTSQSGSKFRFPANLKKHIGVEIDNYSVGGGSAFSSMRKYLDSSNFQNNPPKLIIWEMPILELDKIKTNNQDHGFLDTTAYLQMTSAIHGNCKTPIIFENFKPDQLLFSNSNAHVWPIKKRLRTEVINLNNQNTTKIIFNNEQDPWLAYDYNVGSPIGGRTFLMNATLWTDVEQPKEVSLFVHTPDFQNVTAKTFELTTQAKDYTLDFTFPQTVEASTILLRVDGQQKPLQESYFYLDNVSLTETTSVEPNNNSFLLPNHELLYEQYYVYLQLSDKTLNSIDINLSFAQGSQKSYQINKTTRISNTGRFSLKVPQVFFPLEQVSIFSKGQTVNILSAEVCSSQ